jgi:hypothetical protein
MHGFLKFRFSSLFTPSTTGTDQRQSFPSRLFINTLPKTISVMVSSDFLLSDLMNLFRPVLSQNMETTNKLPNIHF